MKFGELSMRTDTEVRNELEKLVDAHGIADVLGFLCEVCAEKEEHLISAWQDLNSARLWQRTGQILDRATSTITSLWGK